LFISSAVAVINVERARASHFDFDKRFALRGVVIATDRYRRLANRCCRRVPTSCGGGGGNHTTAAAAATTRCRFQI